MKRRLVGVALLALIAAACAGAETGQPAPTATSPATTPPSPSPSPTPTESPSPTRNVTVELWFAQDGRLFPTKRTEAFQPAVAKLALTALLEGPTAAEGKAGAETAIPDGTILRGVNIADGVATVDLDSEFGSGGSAADRKLRLAQVVYTVTQFPSVKAMRLRLDGEPIRSFGGRSLAKPQTRKAYESLLPAIVVESPRMGASVSSPVAVRGTANVFEATVSLRILDARGKEIIRTFTTATCGTGCRGDYSKSVRFSVPSKQRGTIEVFEESAETGEPINVVRIPVTLLP